MAPGLTHSAGGSNMEFEDIPKQQQDEIKAQLIKQIQEMNAAELKIVRTTEASLALYIGKAIQALAALLGYMIAVPFAWARMAADGFREGFDRGFNIGQ
jgi:hypothetical protein